MDSRGNIHELPADAAVLDDLIPIPDEELDRIKAMTTKQRRGWYQEQHMNRHERRKAAKMARRAATEERMKARKAKQ